VVRVSFAGICGTDLEIARGYMQYRGVPGHEFVGRVVESQNSALRGKRVVGEINAGCGRCTTCAAGLARHCPNRTVLGILGRDGAFADFLRLPDLNLIPIPDSIPDDVAVFVEPLAAAYEIFEQVHLARNQTIVVVGDGRLGTLVALALKGEKYLPILAGHHQEKLARLDELGLETAEESSLRDKFDVAIDCSGTESGFRRAVELVRPRGKIILKSTAAAAAEINLAPVVVNEITVVGSRCGRRRQDRSAPADRRRLFTGRRRGRLRSGEESAQLQNIVESIVKRRSTAPILVGIDTGGTFTDLVALVGR